MGTLGRVGWVLDGVGWVHWEELEVVVHLLIDILNDLTSVSSVHPEK